MVSEPTRPGNAIELGRLAWVRPGDVRFTFSRSSGPGGQAVNKLSTRAELRVSVAALQGLDNAARNRLRRSAGQRLTRADEIVIHADTHRSQRDNREACVERLRELVTKAERRPKRRKPTRPSRGAVQRRLDEKRRRSEKKSRRRNGSE